MNKPRALLRHPLLLTSWLLAALGLSACSSVTMVRVPNGTVAGQPGAPLDPVTIPPCKVLNADQRGACVYTVNDCPNGIAIVRAERKGRDTVVTLQCFVPNAADDGAEQPAPEDNPTDDGEDTGL